LLLQARLESLQVWPPQQAWPTAPQVAQVPFWQRPPGLQVPSAQQACPGEPQFT
jgi:hypothetical protein